MAVWTDYADWTSKETLKLTSSFDIFSAIVSALNERIVFFNQRYQSYYPEPYGSAIPLIDIPQKLDIYDYRETYQGYQYLNYISDQVFGLVNGFTNPGLDPVVNGMPGYFVEGIGMLNWTESAIVSEIGDSERYVVSKLDTEIPAEWAFQIYKVINLLRYVSIRLPNELFLNGLSLSRMTKSGNLYYLPFPQSVADFIAADYETDLNIPYSTGSSVQHIVEPYRYEYIAYSDTLMHFNPKYNCKIYGTEYPYSESTIQTRRHDYWGLGTNKGKLIAECQSGEISTVIFPYPNLDLIPLEYDSQGYRNGLYFGAIIDGQSGEDGFTFVAGS